MEPETFRVFSLMLELLKIVAWNEKVFVEQLSTPETKSVSVQKKLN